MAITAADYFIWQKLSKEGNIPPSPSVLEIGQANWYGDVPLNILAQELSPDAQAFLWQLERDRGPNWLFDLAKLFYGHFLKFDTMQSIDLHGTPSTIKHDLNYEWEGHVNLITHNAFDVIINTGTAEHVWRISQVFETMHDACKPGGLMLHCLPFRGWLDHGFWSVNPTLIRDLETTNGYERLCAAYFELNEKKFIWLEGDLRQINLMAKEGKLGANALLYVVWRKANADEFKVPMQGYYEGTLTEEEKREWETMR